MSYARVARELERYAPHLRGRADLDYEADHPRFQAVVALHLLMDGARNLGLEMAKLRKDLRERLARMRKLVANLKAAA